LEDGKVDSGKFNEGNMRGGPEANVEGDGTRVLPTTSSIKYTMPSISTTSGQASSTQESQHDSDTMPEAEAGGPDLASVSSTSRLSASLGLQEEEFANMHKSDPAGTLRLLLSKRQSQTNTSSEHTTSDSAPSNADINSRVRQDSLLLRLTTDFANKDILKELEEEPTRAYSYLAFLKKLHNPLTNETTLGKVIQLSSIIDQFAKAVQKHNENDRRLVTQQQAQTMFYEKAQKAQAEVDMLTSQLNEGNPGIESCDKNIAYYKQQIKVLEEQIVGYRRQIIEEEAKKARLEQEAKATTQEQIDAYGREGIQAFCSAEVVDEEIKSLENSNLVVEKELATLKKIYSDCTKDL
jgi:chromosome segregation ATPase